MINPLSILLLEGESLSPRVAYFSDSKLTVGVIVGLQNEFLAQMISLNSFENGPSGDYDKSALDLITAGREFIPESDIFFRYHTDGKIDGRHPK